MTKSAPKHLWFVRTDRSKAEFLNAEAEAGRLRQGWGYQAEHDLRLFAEHKNKEKLGVAKGNLRMLNVKQGDWLVATNLPSRQQCTVLMATEDFRSGYTFDIAADNGGDYGHCFPVEKLFSFSIHAAKVEGDLRGTLKCRSRFWKRNNLIDNIIELFDLHKSNPGALGAKSTEIGRLNVALDAALKKSIDQEVLKQTFSDELNKRLQASEWEYALVHVLQSLYPSYVVERCGGVTEKEHGADILIKIPNPLADEDFLIAVQVKDYRGTTGDSAIKQIEKSIVFHTQEPGSEMESESSNLLETWVIFTGIESKDVPKPDGSKTRIMGKSELDQLLSRYALTQSSLLLDEPVAGS